MSDYGDLAYQIALNNQKEIAELKEQIQNVKYYNDVAFNGHNHHHIGSCDVVKKVLRELIDWVNDTSKKLEVWEGRMGRLQQQLFTACVILNAQADALIEQAHAIIALEESNKNLD